MRSSALRPFGALPDGSPVDSWRLTDSDADTDAATDADTDAETDSNSDSRAGSGSASFGLRATILAYGATLHELWAPDRDGRPADVVLGFADLADYLEPGRYFGCVVGRYANRIAGGTFPLGGREIRLPLNDGPRPNTLHGGSPGFGARLWTSAAGVTEVEGGGTSVTLTRVSPDGEEGFPGEVTVSVRYTLAAGRLTLDYRAETSAPTVLNLSNHARFNLAGEGTGSILDHELSIAADAFLPVDEALIPLGEAAPVAGTPYDFRSPTPVGARLADPRLAAVGGYDHCFVLRGGRTAVARPVVALRDPASGRTMRIATTEPGLQLFLSSELDGSLTGVGGHRYERYAGLVLETQHFPDSPHQPDFPSTWLLPGEVFRSTTVFDFRGPVKRPALADPG